MYTDNVRFRLPWNFIRGFVRASRLLFVLFAGEKARADEDSFIFNFSGKSSETEFVSEKLWVKHRRYVQRWRKRIESIIVKTMMERNVRNVFRGLIGIHFYQLAQSNSQNLMIWFNICEYPSGNLELFDEASSFEWVRINRNEACLIGTGTFMPMWRAVL